jgi:hypothetical protein
MHRNYHLFRRKKQEKANNQLQSYMATGTRPKAEKRPKQYIKREKSTFDVFFPIFPILLEKNNNFLKNVIR